MKINSFNICPSCVHITTCVLTMQKELVWSCSEYDYATTLNDVQLDKNQEN
ncbi:hypothetical protein QO206_02375 [Leeuwenhoekiella aequorea]|uniref:Uncharacterized protein n=1 Tax=Leeuwenhoekiella aequorea TaxID=283736 RepID=A0A4Q0PCL4_9FLAO|nr:hypothetical protein [Leeuwenhoekiella aequorea]RXG24544.1 hypothetical protein DSM00_334 [Leeuwenhoekiella aequorea]